MKKDLAGGMTKYSGKAYLDEKKKKTTKKTKEKKDGK